MLADFDSRGTHSHLASTYRTSIQRIGSERFSVLSIEIEETVWIDKHVNVT
jgi:hypothetical protein